MTCDLNCYGAGAEAVALPGASGGGDSLAVSDLSLEVCKNFCIESRACEGIVYGHGRCYGKRNIYTSKCMPGMGEYSTEILGAMPRGVCALLGDPHIVTFDNPTGNFLDQFSVGEYHLVKSSQVRITGRFGYSERFPADSSAVGVAVSGALIGGHTLVATYCGPEAGPKGFKVFWDGKVILADLPSTFKAEDESLRAEFDMMDPSKQHSKAGHTIGQDAGTLPSYLFTFVPNWKIYVLLGVETVNVIIEMPKVQSGQDGYCGNFNCDPEDDTLEALSSRNLAGVVAPSESLFAAACPMPAQQQQAKGSGADHEDCEAGLRGQAEVSCGQIPEQSLRQACIYDVCAAGSVSVAADEVAVGQVEQQAEIDAGEIAGKFASGLLRLGVPTLPWQWFMGSAFFGACAFSGCVWLGRASRSVRRQHQRVSALDLDGFAPGAVAGLYDALAREAEASGSDGEEAHLLA